MKKGQISTEVMYSVGIMILVFLILTGISFNRRSEVRKLDEFVEKRSECLKLSNFLTSINTFGPFSIGAAFPFDDGFIRVNVKNYADIFENGVIFIRDLNISETSIEATCTFTAHLDKPSYSLIPGINYFIHNIDRNVTIRYI